LLTRPKPVEIPLPAEATSTPVPTQTLEPTAALTDTPAPESQVTVMPTTGDLPSTEPMFRGNFFAELALADIYDAPFDASVFEGKPALINIWATWCNPCVVEMPHLEELSQEYADKITIIGLHAEGMTVKDDELVPWEEQNEAARALAERLGLTFPLINPDINLFVLMNFPDYGLQVTAFPTTWLLDENGIVSNVILGARDKEGWQQEIDSFLEHLEERELEKNEG